MALTCAFIENQIATVIAPLPDQIQENKEVDTKKLSFKNFKIDLKNIFYIFSFEIILFLITKLVL